MLQKSQIQIQELQIPTSLKEYLEKGPKLIEKLRIYSFSKEKFRQFNSHWFNPMDFIEGEAADLESQGTHQFEL